MRRAAFILLALATLGACQQVPSPVGARFQLGERGSVGPERHDAAGRVKMEVRLTPGASQRRVLAIGADVDAVVVRVEGRGRSQARTLTREMMGAGVNQVAFDQLPAGAYTYRIEARDARGFVLGLRTGEAEVTSGQTTAIDETLTLSRRSGEAPFVGALVPPGPPGAADVRAVINLVSPAEVLTPPIEGQFGLADEEPDVRNLVLHPDGSVWFSSGHTDPEEYDDSAPIASYGWVHRLTPTGIIEDYTPGHAAYDVAVPFTAQRVGIGGPAGTIFLQGNADYGFDPGAGYVLDAAGAPDSTFAFTAHQQALMDQTGVLWTFSRDDSVPMSEYALEQFVRGAAGPRRLTSFGAFRIPTGLTLAPNGDVWCASVTYDANAEQIGRLTRHSPSGAAIATADVPGLLVEGEKMAVDLAGRLWSEGERPRTLRVFSPDVVQVLEVPIAVDFNRIYVDPSGDVWTYYGAAYTDLTYENAEFPENDLIARISPEGEVRAYYHIGEDVRLTDLKVTTDGTLWLGTASSGLLKVKVDVPFAP